VALNRLFIKNKSNSLGVKAHYKIKYPDDLVGLHHFSGGYCGVSKVESDLINICYLADYNSFKKYKSIDEFQEEVLFKNKHLHHILTNAILQFDKPLTISQVSFAQKENIYNHIIMIGDTAGLIHPLCGNGMAMAIHSAKLASDNILSFLSGKINRIQMEKNYSTQWNYNFKNRLQMGRILSFIMQKKYLANIVLQTITFFPFLLPIIIKKTHGKPI
jgi:flavin-dependent dehydrogenase